MIYGNLFNSRSFGGILQELNIAGYKNDDDNKENEDDDFTSGAPDDTDDAPEQTDDIITDDTSTDNDTQDVEDYTEDAPEDEPDYTEDAPDPNEDDGDGEGGDTTDVGSDDDSTSTDDAGSDSDFTSGAPSPYDDSDESTDGGDIGSDDGADASSDDASIDGGDDNSRQADSQLLGDENDQNLKNIELKQNYQSLYLACDDIIKKLGEVPKLDNNAEVIKKIVNQASDLKTYIEFYLTNTYSISSYTDNLVMFQKYLTILNSIRLVISELSNDYESSNNAVKENAELIDAIKSLNIV